MSTSRPADKGFCKTISDRLGISQIAAEEALIGEPVDECWSIVRWIEMQEVEMRAQYGWSYTFKNFNHGRLLKRWAEKHKKGAFRRE